MKENSQINVWPCLCVLASGLLFMLAFSAYAWRELSADAMLAIHWNIRGEADGFSSKPIGLLLLPAICFATVFCVLGLVKLDPRRRNVAQSQRFLTISMAGLVIMMSGLHAATTVNALGWAVPMNEVVMSFTGALFAVLGNYMGKVRSNFFMGVRTPWTLSSELSWNKTNRLCGRLFFAAGLLTLVLAWISSAAAIAALLVTAFTATLIAVVYSYFVWKHDPDRQPLDGVSTS